MIIFSNVTKWYKNKKALNKINLELKEGYLYLFTGENGSGKTTMMKLIASRIKLHAIDIGIIDKRNTKIAYLADELEYPKLMKIYDYLMCIKKIYSSKGDIFNYMSKYELANKYIFECSKGMYKKIGIIQMLLNNSDYYLYDEPLDGLDEASRIIFLNDIQTLLKENKTVVIITHYIELFNNLKYVIINFNDGNINEKIY